MSVDFSQIINNFLSAELGEDVRSSLVAIAQALQDAINAQLNTVTSDLTDPSANAAAQAKTVGDILYGTNTLATPKIFNYWTSSNLDSFGITDIPRMSITTNYGSAFSDLPASIDPSHTIAIWRININIAGNVSVIYLLDRFNKNIYYTTYSEDAAWSGTWNRLVTDSVYDLLKNDDEIEVYSNFSFIPGKVYSGAAIIDTPTGVNLGATEKMPCKGGCDYYNRFPNYNYNSVTVVFFDENNQIIGSKGQAAFDSYSYISPDGTQTTQGYVGLLKFTTPANARYFAFNWSLTEANKKYFYVSNVPVFMIGAAQPDIVIKLGDPVLAKREKRLCVMGTSGVMIDRLYRTAAGDYICGFQEYLRPYYKDVISYGYSSATYAVGGTDEPSIYEYITQGVGSLAAKDFTNIDEVLFIQSGSALSTLQVGDVGGLTEETVDPTTMIGAIRGIIQYILAQNPKCKIYIASFYKYNNSLANTEKVYAMQTATKELCKNLGCTYVDLWEKTPFNYSNYNTENLIYTYDGGHANSDGNRELGMVLRNALIYGGSN